MRFVFPNVFYERPGGENLVYEIVKAAFNSKHVESVILGNPTSFAVQRLKKDNIPFRFYSNEDIREFVPSCSDRFIHTHNYDGLSDIVGMPGSCLVWGILAPQITGWNRFGFEKRITGQNRVANWFTERLIHRLSKNSGLISMDGDTSDAIDAFIGKHLDLPIIPIPVDTTSILPAKQRAETLPMVLSYIGRSDDIWKIKPVKKVVRDLHGLAPKQFRIDIYTDRESPFVEELNTLIGNNVSLEFHIGYYGPTLRERIAGHSTLHFSMGTA